MKKKHLIREKFRDAVFARDMFRCRICGNPNNLDAHHIINRNDMPNGGYVKENGISLCEECHIKAEEYYEFYITKKLLANNGYFVEDLFKVIGSNEELARQESEKLNNV